MTVVLCATLNEASAYRRRGVRVMSISQVVHHGAARGLTVASVYATPTAQAHCCYDTALTELRIATLGSQRLGAAQRVL